MGSTFAWKNEVREHQYFENLQWDAILEHSTMPPYQPELGGDDQELATTSSIPPNFLRSVDTDATLNTKIRFSLDSSMDMSRIGTSSHLATSNPRNAEVPETPSGIEEEEEEVPLPDPTADLSCFEGF